jgi:hypothetical protein
VAAVRAPSDPAPLVTLHLFGVAHRHVPAAVLRMGLDRPRLAGTPGLRVWKLLGTGSGRSFRVRDADPCRWGLLGVWSHPEALVAFERRSATARAWRRLAAEAWRADLRPLRSRGAWSGARPFDPPAREPWQGMVASITRARLARGRWRQFWRAVPPVSAALRDAPGLRFALGIGEAPVGMQGTFSVWASAAALVDYAHRGAAHRDAIRRTAETGWYAEELFARFAVLQTTGTVGGVDPVRASLASLH